ncbi:SAM12-like protein [Mya arenaria]|uniref:SAM12-like protein n=1 Tax=Mya arenaria TaxID=6604 RepID=A0ABY7FL50_MYAAR|nr:sterile alpha motif domain-containing protein 12-like [Mya arenaria]XP_052776883.1 sterile alpha motif domain-containing protein 12-like [Mya arenaria]XP_052776884.1 sterile alpha motif domain-containing protein 12-like [Mya arenaria]WAR22867.1 SAM12-like protein [Mya arenaria]
MADDTRDEKVQEPASVAATKPASTGKKVTRSKTKPLYFWTSADVNKWLKKHGGHCHELYGQLFLEQEVTGRSLIRLTEYKLEKIGILNLQHRQELMHYVLKLRLKHEGTDLKNLDQRGSGFELPVPDIKRQSVKKKDDKR